MKNDKTPIRMILEDTLANIVRGNFKASVVEDQFKIAEDKIKELSK